MSLAATLLMSLVLLQSPKSAPKAVEYKETMLPNGLTIITHEDHSTPVVNLQMWYHVGSKDERPGRTGFAHLFEHLMFKGSANVEPEEHDKIISSAGGQSNAYTTDDVTVYFESFPANYLEKVIWLEADRMVSLDVSQENFIAEREVVKEERLTRVENPPYGDLFELLYRNAFDVHPYKSITIGSMEDLNAATLTDVRDFYETWYVPDNATLVIAGDFQTEPGFGMGDEVHGRHPEGETANPPHGGDRAATRERTAYQSLESCPAAGVRRRVLHSRRRTSGFLSTHNRVEHPFAGAQLADISVAGL